MAVHKGAAKDFCPHEKNMQGPQYISKNVYCSCSGPPHAWPLESSVLLPY